MEALIREIHNQKQNLMNANFDTKNIDFLKDFDGTKKSLSEMDFIDLLVIFYMMKKSVSLDKAFSEVGKISRIVLTLTSRRIKAVLDYMDSLKYLNEFYEITDFSFESYLSLKGLNPHINMIKILLKLLLKANCADEEINEFLKWGSDSKLYNIVFTAAVFKDDKIQQNKEEIAGIKRQVRRFNDANGLNRFLKRNVSKVVNELVNEHFRDDFDIVNIQAELNAVKRYQLKFENEQVSFQRNIRRQIKNLELFEKEINQGIISIEQLTKYNLDSKLENLLLIELIKQKNSEFKKTWESVLSYKEKSTFKIEDMLNRYKYNFFRLTKDEQNTLLTMDTLKLEENLNFISNSSLRFLSDLDESFVNVLTLDINLLKQLDLLLVRNKITTNFILRYVSKLNETTIKRIIDNVDLLSLLKINFDKLDEELLFELNPQLINMFSSYGMDLKNISLTNYGVFKNAKVFDLIDQYIEAGFIDRINDLDNLNSVVLKRMIVMQEMDEEYRDFDINKEFYVGDLEIDDYIGSNYLTYINDEINEVLKLSDNLDVLTNIPLEIAFIEDYRENDFVYRIGGYSFSRIKVLRCMKTLIDLGYSNYKEILINVLMYNYPKHLSFETIEELKSINKDSYKKQLI